MRNIIAIQKGMVLVPTDSKGYAVRDNSPLAASLQAELMNLGFMLDAGAFEAVRQAPREWIVAYHKEVVPYLQQRLGADRAYQPFYRNFPAQVMQMGHLELFLNAVVHYWSDGRWEPPQVLRDRGFAFEGVSFRPIRVGNEAQFKAIFTTLVSINQSLSEQDKQTLEWFLDHRDELGLELPETIPFKETLCMLAARGMDVPVKTPTDVLRIAVYLSGGDISLPGVPKVQEPPSMEGWPQWYADRYRESQAAVRAKFRFKHFSRAQRRFLLGLLEKTGADPAEMQRHLGRWLRLGEILHVGEHAERFPRAVEAFRQLRNQSRTFKVRTFAGRVNLALRADWRQGLELLATRPGELARRLDWLLRTYDAGAVLETFERVGHAVSAKVLIELYNHFAARVREDSGRMVMLKGRGSKVKALPALPPMGRDLVQRVGNVIAGLLKARFAALEELGKVWIDPRLREVPVPFGMRSVNTAVRTYVRGTRVPYRADAKVIRAFLHWYDEQGSIDLDLSAGFYSEELRLLSHVSFTHLKDEWLNCCHSGDIRHRQGPCAEYVDVDVKPCLEHGVRYVIVQAFNYDGRPMHAVKDCVFGLMEREDAVANEIFVPKTIANCMRLANEGTCVLVCIIDLAKGQYIWADVESQRSLPTLENTVDGSVEVLRALLEGMRMSMYDLLSMHAQARGAQVQEPAQADLVLKWEDFVTDYAHAATYMGA